MIEKLSATRVAKEIGVHRITLLGCYKWYRDPHYTKPKDMPKLPAYKRNSKKGKIWWWNDDIPKLQTFKDWLDAHKGRGGVMGSYNKQFQRKEKPVSAKQHKETEESKEPICYKGIFSF